MWLACKQYNTYQPKSQSALKNLKPLWGLQSTPLVSGSNHGALLQFQQCRVAKSINKKRKNVHWTSVGTFDTENLLK